MSAGPYTIRGGNANACPAGCGRFKTRSAALCRECRTEALRRQRANDGRDRDRLVLERRAAGASLRAIAVEIGVSRARAQQIATRAAARQELLRALTPADQAAAWPQAWHDQARDGVLRSAVVGGLPLDTHSRPGAEPSGVPTSTGAGARVGGSPDGGSPETERAIAGVPASPGRMHLARRLALIDGRDDGYSSWAPGELTEAWGR